VTGSGSLQALDDRALPLDKAQQVLIAAALGLSQIVRSGVLSKPVQALLFERPLLNEDNLINEVPSVDLALDLREFFPARDGPFQEMIDIGSRRSIYLSHSTSSGMLFGGFDDT
jgi:hypothetical protein